MEVPTIKCFVRNNVLLLLFITIVKAQIAPKISTPNSCALKERCGECIQTPGCAWCYDPNFGNEPRCFDPELKFQQHKKCPEEFVFFPDNIQNFVTNLELTKVHKGVIDGDKTIAKGIGESYNAGGVRDKMVQVAPQRIRLKLRPGKLHSIEMKYTQAEDYPMDVYYLMGLSKSMSDNEKLLHLGERLATTTKQLTSHFRLGFGTFVDKVVMSNGNNLTEK
ncbi:unnamed protein product [Diabrotica balteata]|uniref:Integrin beta subunit VWA domain-containing protein n=1 Tax=Diabrotica balteata TaxID=107213 RepID=A0A9N9T313_DIABA|nr:unnamed protein product [Diabrotica balteata]